MSGTQASLRAMQCDGCALEASPEHLRRRIARLEWASRYRPIHITTLILAPAPTEKLEDFFYAPEGLPREPAALALYEDLLAACGMAEAKESKERALAEFQRGGFFLADAMECPMEIGGATEFDALLARLTPTVLRRVRFSYRPKSVLVLSEQLVSVAKALGKTELDAQLLLREGGPVSLADASDAEARKRFRDEVSALLARRA